MAIPILVPDGIKYIKISRIDNNGVDNTLALEKIRNNIGFFKDKNLICIIGDGHGYFGTLIKKLNPKIKIILKIKMISNIKFS